MTRGHALLVSAALAAALGGVAAAAVLRGRAVAEPPRNAPPRALVSGAVTFRIPPAWIVQGWLAERGSEGVALFVPCAPLDDTPHSANVNLLAEPNTDGADLSAWSARRLAVAARREIVEERREGAWRTVVSTGEDRGARYVVVERFGVSGRGRVHAVAAFPASPAVGEGWFARTGEEVARFLDSLALEGAPASRVRLAYDGATLRLAAAGR